MKTTKIEEEFAGDEATIEWLNAQKGSTQATYRKGWRLFKTFTGLTGDEILKDRENDTEAKWEKKTLAFKDWIITQKTQTGKNYSEGAARTFTIAVRSFFGYHRKELKFRRAESTKLKTARPKRESYRFTRHNLADMFNIADLQGKYVIAVGKSFGLRVSDFLNVRRGDLEPYVKQKPPISIGEYTTKKEKVPAYPFIDTDALPVIKAMIRRMDTRGMTSPQEKMLTIGQTQVNNIIKKLTAQAGINVGTKRVTFHCLRKFLIDRLASHMAESKWKQIVGKQIDEKAYVSTDLLRDPYERTMDDTCFTKMVSEEERRIQATFDNMRLVGFSDDVIEAYKKQRGKTWRTAKELITAIRQRARTQTNGGSRVNDCLTFKEIDEVNLLTYLRAGWRIVHTNSNGKVIIQRD